MVTPEKLFRYFAPQASNILAERKLWFSPPADFNDLFEAMPRNDEVVRSIIEQKLLRMWALTGKRDSYNNFKKANAPNESDLKAMYQRTQTAVQAKASNRFHIVCFSEHETSLLMWGHYAAAHRGFVLEFDPRHDLFLSEEFHPVTYSNERPSIPKLGRSKEPFLFKSTEWKYEDEHRLIRNVDTLDLGKRREWKGKDGVYDYRQMYFAHLPIQSVKSVFLGARMPPDSREEILTSLKASDAHHIERFVLRPHPTQYALERCPL